MSKAPARSSWRSEATPFRLHAALTDSTTIFTASIVDLLGRLPICSSGRRWCCSAASVIRLPITASNTLPTVLSSEMGLHPPAFSFCWGVLFGFGITTTVAERKRAGKYSRSMLAWIREHSLDIRGLPTCL